MANNKVKFLRGTSNEYAVAEKDNDAIYFTTDDGKLYIGNKEISGDGNIQALNSHINDSVKHITSTERTNWNSAKTHADSAHAPSNAQANVIETIKVNGKILTPVSKAVDITVPTNNNQLTNGAGYITSSGTAKTISDTLPISKGGTGKTTGEDAANALINSLSTGGDGTPTDNDYFISQQINGGTTYTSYFRRPVSKLWEYIKSKLATVATSGSYNDLSNKPTIPSVGNGTITIKQAGTTKGTFTTNQSGNTTIELTDNNTDTWRPLGTTADTACAGNDARLSNARPASDVYAWAKASSKPSYTWNEITNKPSTFTPSSHTHSYAGASSSGGSATSAVKLDSSAGSATQPIYFSGGKPVACSYTLGKSVPSNAVFTDTNTWRGIQNNLTSDSTTDSLSAAQGKILKGLVDGKAAASHSHKYAGSSSAGGAATTALKCTGNSATSSKLTSSSYTTISISTSDWANNSSGGYVYTKTLSSAMAYTNFNIDVVLSTDQSAAKLQIEAWNNVIADGEITQTTSNGSTTAFTFYAFTTKPSVALTVGIQGVS